MFARRSEKLERIDTGDYTLEEYDRFLVDIGKVNRYAGDSRALRTTLLNQLGGSESFSVLDVGAGSGELLRETALFARKRGLNAKLVGLELNERAASTIKDASEGFPEISSVRADALALPFSSGSFDFVISSLFAHHLTDGQIVAALAEMGRVAASGVILIDLHRHPLAYVSYKAFCLIFRISRLVREDGSLSILRGFHGSELEGFAAMAGLQEPEVLRRFPFRLVLRSRTGGGPDTILR